MDHPKRLTILRSTTNTVIITMTHIVPDIKVRKSRFRSRNIKTTDQPYKIKTSINNKLKTGNSHFERAGALLTFHVPITIMICQANKKRHKSNTTTKKKRVSCEMKLVESGL